VAALIVELDELRWTGRKGYGARTLVGACLVESLYAIPTWTRVSALIAEHRALADSISGHGLAPASRSRSERVALHADLTMLARLSLLCQSASSFSRRVAR
jgi:hypothetical protein